MTEKGAQKLALEWRTRVEAVEYQENFIISVKTSEVNARNELGKSIVPEDAKPGEKFSVWVRFDDFAGGEGLVEVTVPEEGILDYKIKLRS